MASSIPQKCTVLVVGGGPGGSFAAAALAREGIDTVVLEGAKFPRYHIGESMLASIRHLLRFIELDSTFDMHGFTKKPGAAFKLNKGKREGYTDFLAAGGPDNYAWNVIRSEADDLIFRHAGKSGAKIFDGVKVTSVIFDNTVNNTGNDEPSKANIGRPLSATYTITDADIKGEISFDYIVDASGRAGLLSTKYLKNRRFNQSLKNVATWGYWQGTGAYAPGTPRENAAFFEALQDETGWAWFIPLHDGTTSVGVVMNQKAAANKKSACNHKDSAEFYSKCLEQAPNIISLIGKGGLSSGIKSASDYSYSASSYAIPYARIVGDAGCFIDPYFSSGVHLALTGGLSAAMTICASIRKHCYEASAASWHSQKVADSYTRFLLVVLTAYRQILSQEEAVLSDFDEDNYDRAFALFRPVIQGTADANNGALTDAELTETLDFCATAFEPVNLKADGVAVVGDICSNPAGINAAGYHPDLSPEQIQAVKHIRARQMMRIEDCMHLSNFRTDVIHGYAPIMERGQLGLKKTADLTMGVDKSDLIHRGDLALDVVLAHP